MTTDRRPAPTHRLPPRLRSPRQRLWDRLLVLDPGFVKSEGALRTLLCVPAGMAVGYAVALQFGLPAVLGLMIGAMPAFITCLVIVDPSAGRVAGRTGAVIVPFVAALAGSIALHPFRILELVLIVVLLFVQFLAFQWGKWASDAAIVAFSGYLCGLLLPLPETSVLPLSIVVAASLAATIVIRTVFLRPDAYRSLLRVRRGFLARGADVLEASAAALAVADDSRARARALRRLARRRSQYHEIALTVDGMLAASGTDAADELHRLVFDTHFAIDELGRAAATLVEQGAPEDVRHAALRAVTIVLRHGGSAGDDAGRTLAARFAITASAADPASRTTVLVHRMAREFADLRTAGLRWREVADELPRSGDGVPFASPVILAGGRPAGAVPVVADAVAEGPWRRLHMTASLRTAVHAAIAVAITEPLALLLDGSRFYWGVIGVMIVLAGTNTTHERVRKGIHRGVGTVVGGIVGIALVHVLGTDHPWVTMVLVCVLLAVGTYGFGGVYAVWAACLVVVLCQVYDFSGTFTNALIPIRLAENLLGATIAILVSIVVLPLATRSVVRRAVRRQLVAVRAFVLATVGVDVDETEPADAADPTPASRPTPAAAPDLRARSRAVDAATYQLEAVLKPMVRFPTGGPARADARMRASLQAAATFARELAGRPGAAPVDVPATLRGAAEVLAASVDRLADRVVAGPGTDASGSPAWTRITDVLEGVVATADPGDAGDAVRARVHALGRIDESLALFAERVGMPVVAGAATRMSAVGGTISS
ncbi:putative membrane protein YccC [Curtobacterium sp. PhB130]|uniref:FUSC family protein n=1 Tax=Curtobacterium sp. PhB130 TaxID=2485178 RepID=UPI000FACDC23|nr:FUSC family protein [Curtobacterium sp. PhB130]ROS73737.1 putative membrane protein YccC [Curtobacterium sp. PhB130]